MRLIDVETRKLKEFTSGTPEYAILSHRWGAEEITFDEIQSRPNENKAGWHKIDLSCKQAKIDGYGYLWCDTCCIDKSSSAELSESINSMFRWYQEAEVCYAFLDDVQNLEELAGSKWFTRGWTLQELIAPKRLTFYNSGWQKIGAREEFATRLSEITGINREALRGTESVSYVRGTSLAKRIAWAANRETTRDEDIAYCLMGLLEINMPLLYGEGGTKAFGRLQQECIKLKLDQSFLTWLSRPSDERGGNSNMRFLARHPKDFEGCNRISLTSDDVDTFSLNNKGLQIRLPVFQNQNDDAIRSPEYFAILACYPEDRPSHRIGIPLYAVERSAKTFMFLPSREHRLISTDEFDAARLRDCFILRISKHSATRMLSINAIPVSLVSWKPKIVYFDTSASTWTYLCKPMALEIPLIRAPVQQKPASYGVLFYPPSPCPETRGSDDENNACLKVLVRVDVGFEERYSVNVSIQLFYVAGNEFWTDQSNFPSIPTSEIPSKSRSQIVSIPTQQSKTLNVSTSWKRMSNQDVLFLDINLIAANELRAHGLYTRSISVFKSLLTEEPLIHGVYASIVIWFLFPSNPFEVFPFDTIAVGVPAATVYYTFGKNRLARYIRPGYREASWRLPVILGVLLLSHLNFDDYNGVPSARYRAASHWVMASWYIVAVELDFAKRTGYIAEHAKHEPAEKLDPKVGLKSLLLDD